MIQSANFAQPSKASTFTTIVSSSGIGFLQEIAIGKHLLIGDEPIEAGGTDAGPSPYDYILAALGTCTSMTLTMYARQKQWPLQGVTVRLGHSKIHAEDCEECAIKPRMLDRIDREIELAGSLTAEQRARLLEVAEHCPVHQTLTSTINIRSRLA
jgi:putative redox protein